MTKAELVQEVVDRGFDYVATSRIQNSIERAYQRICSRFPWPFLEVTATGEGAVEITDLRRVLSVNANEESLPGVDRRWLAEVYSDLTTTGGASYWYVEGSSLKVFPVDTATVTVRYIKRPAVLSDSDTPLIPSEWQYLMVDLAVVDCLRDDDEYEAARALKGDVEEGLREMAHALLNRNYQNDNLVVRSGRIGDYL